MNTFEFVRSSLPVAVAAASPVAIEMAQYCHFTVREQVGVGVVVLAGALGVHWVSMQRREEKHETVRKQEKLERVLNTVVLRTAEREHTLDPIGDLDVRMNVMIPYRRRLRGFVYQTAYDRPARHKPREDVILHMYCCSRNSKGRSSLWAGWKSGEGCVGRLWKQGDHIVAAALPEGADLNDYNLTKRQAQYTRDTRCLISVAITEGIGPDLRRRGILNISSSNEYAIEAWTEDGQPRQSVTSYLVELAHTINDENLLPA